ncbi:MAG TPA: beta-galactosidase [Armatimonadota bacterium]|nr:hypothetical protein [Armatimonadota bacterium]HPT97859.1 beta-galactosidase [Armatimonadota bacterium]
MPDKHPVSEPRRVFPHSRLAPGVSRCRSLAFLACLALLIAGVPCAAQGRIEPGLAWCGGVVNPADYAACRATGFDAVRIDVPWRTVHSWEATDALVEQACAAGLRVIVALPLASPPASFGPVDPLNATYLAQMRQWVQDVIEHYRDNPGVLAWMVADEPETVLHLTDAGFQAFLQGRYGDLKTLNDAWGSRYRRFSDFTARGALLLAQPRALGVSRSAIDLALYRRQAFTDLLSLWARAIRAADRQRPLLTGAMGYYRCLISAPDEYDAVVARMGDGTLPGQRGPEAVAIARRGGRVAAIASLPPGNLLAAFGDALLQGATGIAVEEWRLIRNNATVRQGLASALASWRRGGCVTAVPQPTTAILYEPFGENPQHPSPLFTGYLAGADMGELVPLFTALRRGTRYGQVAYLSQNDLTPERLSRYRLLLCPAALSLTSENVQALFRFADGGGIIVADAGFGCYEAGGEIHSWSVELATLLGVRALWPAMHGGGRLRVYDKVSLFPSIPAGATTSPAARPAFSDLMAMIQPLPESTVFAAALDRTLPDRKLFGGIVMRTVGKGWVVYASMKLWHRWPTADPLYGAFHHELLSREPAVTLKAAPLLAGDVQVAAFERGLALRNSARKAADAELELPSGSLYAGPCLNICWPDTKSEKLTLRTGLAPGSLGLYERTPIRCTTPLGAVTIAVEEYGPKGMRIAICGGRPNIRFDQRGAVSMTPTFPQKARIVISDGRYRIRPGTRHLLRAKDLASGAVSQYQVVVGADAKIEIEKEFYSDSLTLTPLRPAEERPSASPSH